MSENGWICLHRKTLESSVFEDSIIFKVFAWCLLRAAHKKSSIFFSGKDISLKPGQFITGRDKATNQLKISPQQYRRAISYLKSTSRIITKATNKYSVITVLNWGEFQNPEIKTTSETTGKTTSETTNKQPATNQQRNHKQQDNNANNANNSSNNTSSFGKSKNLLLNFELFWKAYPRKAGKKKAQEWWEKHKPNGELLEKILKAILEQSQTEQWQKDGGKFIPHPITWLNQERWNDEVTDGQRSTGQYNRADNGGDKSARITEPFIR